MLYNNRATDKKKPRPDCDMCQKQDSEPAAVDGKTDFGPWAYMCVDHYRRHGVGLGMGLGQVLLCDDGHDPLLRARYDLVDESARGGGWSSSPGAEDGERPASMPSMIDEGAH